MVANKKMRAKQPPRPRGEKENRPPPAKKGFTYEMSREERIKENLQKMEKLGILNLTRNLNPNPPPPPKPRQKKTFAEPSRRSSRLTTKRVENVEIIKKEDSEASEDTDDEEDLKPEVYTEEHVKLLGDCKTSWTLHVDGFDEDGKRILEGNKCHQCRRKTAGYLTECSKCKLVQGQLCGDCLYMRYGENIIEANVNKDWVCPACRGICNCSSCRKANGWRPTGQIYWKVVSLGFKSVAHYLIKTWGPHANQKEEAVASSIYRVQSPTKLPLPYDRKVKKLKVDRERGDDKGTGKQDDNNADQDSNSEPDEEDDADELTEDDQDSDYEPNVKRKRRTATTMINGLDMSLSERISSPVTRNSL